MVGNEMEIMFGNEMDIIVVRHRTCNIIEKKCYLFCMTAIPPNCCGDCWAPIGILNGPRKQKRTLGRPETPHIHAKF